MYAAAAPYGATAPPKPTSRVELSLSAKSLKNRDVISKSDPFAILSLLDGGRWVEIGRTETLKDNLSPTWTKLFLVDYFFELQQQLKVDIYDEDSSSNKLSKQDYIGGAAFTLSQLMGSPGQSGSFLVTQGNNSSTHRGSLLVRAEEVKSSNELARLRFSGQGLANMDGMFSKSDPFLVISRLREDNSTWVQVHKTEVIDNNLNPNWRAFELPMQQLCNGDHRRQLLFQVWDEDMTKSELIGEVQTSVEEIVAKRGTNFVLHNQKLQQKKGKKYTNAGLLVVHEVTITRMHTFLEYLSGGLEMSLVVGIDYTASNGPPMDPRSLHFIDPRGPNQYQHAISATASILQEYDADKMIPVYGFGGIPPGAHNVDHCFPLNLNPSNPEVLGAHGVLQLYTSSLPHVRLHGPTCFAPIIQQTTAIALSSADPRKQKYFVLLIITDGAIMDMPATIDALVQASNTVPLSIVIIGVGPADFSSMSALDGDGKSLRSSRGQAATRDIVQFVPYSRFANNPALLTRETLAEIPNQLCQFMRVRGINPNPAIPPAFKQFAEPGIEHAGAPGATPAGAPAPGGVPTPALNAGVPPQQPGAPGYPGAPPPAGAPHDPHAHPAQGHPAQGHPAQGYPAQGYPAQGYPGQGGQAPQGYPPQGYPPQGYPQGQQGNPGPGYPPQGQGYPPQGGQPGQHPPQGYPPQGYPPQGYPSQQPHGQGGAAPGYPGYRG